MQLQKARQKLANFEVEIRRGHRDKMIKQLRQELTMPQAELVNKLFKDFVINKHSEIPEFCIHHYKNIEISLLSQLITAMQHKQVNYVFKTQEKWFIDCTSAVNLKFMSLQEIIDCPNILVDFFRETVAINYQKTCSFQQAIKYKEQGKCLFNLVQNQTSGQLQIPNLYEKSNSQTIQNQLILLNFWSTYIQKTQDEIHKQHFMQIMNIFIMYAEFKDILLRRQASIFVKTILDHIKLSNILNHYNNTSSAHYQLALKCYSFINFIKMKMPYLIKKAVDYRLIYYQIAQILHRMYQLSTDIPDLFQLCVSQCQYLNNFIILLLKDQSNPQDTSLNQKSALLVINSVAEYGLFDLLYLNEAITITRQLVNVTLFAHTTQYLCSLVLFNIIYKDREKYLLKIFELLDYEYLLNNLQEGSQAGVYQLLILILQNYNKSETICTKILIDCDLLTLLKNYGTSKEADKLIEELARVIRIHLTHFLDKFPRVVAQIYQLIKEYEFKDREEYMKEFQAHIELAFREAEL